MKSSHQEIKEDVKEKYNRFAPWYDFMVAVPEFLGIGALRRKMLEKASGEVLEIAVGTGRNLVYYRQNCRITAVDSSKAMLEIARKRAKTLGLKVNFLVMDAENLAFGDDSFDTVVDSMGICTFPEPLAALKEMARVCRDGGRILLLEHGRSDRGWIGGWQDRRADTHAKQLGCRWNREPLDLVQEAGLKIISAERRFLGIFHMIEATP
jgi:ubiquinone/menaquinone biosynthesis C-methylase UbiE